MTIQKTILAQLPITLFSALFLLSQANLTTYTGFASLLVFLFANYLFFMMLRTGKTWKYRAMLFIPTSLLFPVYFIHNNILERGSMLIPDSHVYECKLLFCHLVTPALLLPVAVMKEIPYPSTMPNVAAILVLIFGSLTILGRGWCAWGCFYGGWDEAVSLLKKKASFKFTNPRWRLLPYAIMFTTALISAYTLGPFYCKWLCPFKQVTEFKSPVTAIDYVSTVITFVVFFLFIFILPFLSKKRAQCTYFCPLGPTFGTFFNRFNIFAIRTDVDKCVSCGKCIRLCPLNAIDEASLKSGISRPECAKCGKCVDECPKDALSYYVRGTACAVSPDASRLLFLYASFLLMLTLLGNLLAKGLGTLLLLTVGRLF